MTHPSLRPRSFDWTWLAVLPAVLLLSVFLLLPVGLGLLATFTLLVSSMVTLISWRLPGRIPSTGKPASGIRLGPNFSSHL